MPITRRRNNRGEDYATTNVLIEGARQLDIFDAVCVLRRCKPHQLAAQYVRDGIDRDGRDPAVRRLLAILRRPRLRVIDTTEHTQ